MQIFNLVLTAVFLGASLWMGKKVINQRKLIDISGKFFNGYRMFILFCLAASIMTLFLGFEDILDLIRSVAMMCMVAMFLMLKEGAGQSGFVYNGVHVPYETVAHYDIKTDAKHCVLYVVCREKVKDKVEERHISLNLSDRKNTSVSHKTEEEKSLGVP